MAQQGSAGGFSVPQPSGIGGLPPQDQNYPPPQTAPYPPAAPAETLPAIEPFDADVFDSDSTISRS